MLLRRVTQHVSNEKWFAVIVDFLQELIHSLRFWITNLEVAAIMVKQQKIRADKVFELIDDTLAREN